MRYAIFGALILSLELVGVSVAAAAIPANGNAVLKASSSSDVIQVMQGCGKHFHREKGQCVPDWNNKLKYRLGFLTDRRLRNRRKTTVETWREIQSYNIEFVMKRLRKPTGMRSTSRKVSSWGI
jgi:hypothetical protein